jgi:predicted transcriptional regulator
VRIVELLAENPAGLDVLTVAKRLRVRQAQVSPALCRLDAAGRITYVRPARRGLMGVYVLEGGSL